MTSGLNSSLLLSIVTFAYLGAALAYLFHLVFKKEIFGRLGFFAAVAIVVVHTLAIAWRWIESYQLGAEYGHAPFSNLYESLIFFAWTIAVVYIYMELKHKNRLIGAFVLPFSFLAMAYAGLQPQEITPLVPALKSNWLIAHVITCFLGYSGFALAAGLGVMLLVKESGFARYKPLVLIGSVLLIEALYLVFKVIFRNAGFVTRSDSFFGAALNYIYIEMNVAAGILAAFALGFALYLVLKIAHENLQPFRSGVFDNLIYQNIIIGFLLLTAGIVTGAIWAHSAWGTYWSWDPKETWSLITWIVYAAILHSRLVAGWATGRRIAILALIGFGCVLFTYFGVNFLLTGLHSYATGK